MEITPQEALDCLASDDLIGIGMEADAIRRRLHSDDVVTYSVPRSVGLDQPREALLATIEDCARAGETAVCLTQAPATGLAQLEATLVAIRQRLPALHIQALSTGEIIALATTSGVRLDEIFSRLRVAGLDAISGDDLCAVSSDSAPLGLLGLDQWIEGQRAAHCAGITSTAGLVFGLGESSEDRIWHLFAIRALQQKTGGFTAFSLISPKPAAVLHLEPSTAVEYLRTLAVTRIVLDNVPSIESSCRAHGLKVMQMALRFGANDAGSLAPSEDAPKAAFTEEDLRRVIRDAGFLPVERDPLYRTLFLNN